MIQPRKSGIELLKILAIIMIVMSHAIPFTTNGILNDGSIVDYMLNLNLATTNYKIFICNLIRYGGQLGNSLFIVCSSWFLINSNEVKFKKIYNIIIDSLLISIAFLIIYIIIGTKFDFPIIIKQFMPITMNNNWYITCYLLFYLLHPLLNIIIKNINQRELFNINISMFILYSIIGSIFLERFFYTQLIGFIELYFIVAYVKLYLKDFINNKRKNIRILITSSILFFILILITNILGLHMPLFRNKMLHWCYFYNPFIIAISISLFNLFINMNFYNKTINFFSSLSLYVYIIHTNNLYVRYTFLQTYEIILHKFTFNNIILIVLLYGVCLFIVSYIFSCIYNYFIKWLRKTKVYQKIYDLISMFIFRIIENIYNTLRSI